MAEPEFSSDVSKALNAYVVPPLPTGFSDRLMARVAASDAGADVPATGFNNRLRGKGRGASNAWRRSGRIFGSVAFLSLATATAAATGFFGNPVYVPVVSEVLDRAELVASPLQVASPKSIVVAAKSAIDAEPPAPLAPVTGKDAVVDRITGLRENPQFENLTPRQKFGVARKEVRTMVRSGEATPQDAREAVREMIRNADPETKAQWKETAKARRAARLAQADGTDAAITTETKTDAQLSEEIPPFAGGGQSPKKLEALRERYRNASPEQRAQIRRRLRERRSTRTQ
jgi:hypothetical protein